MEVQRNTNRDTPSKWYLLWFVSHGEVLVILGNTPTQISARMPGNKMISNVVRTHVLGVSDQDLHKPGCTNTEDGWRLEILNSGSKEIM